MNNNQNMAIDFESMTDDGKITHIKEYIQRELSGTSHNDLVNKSRYIN